jgi:hypothetical protein
MGLVLVNEFLNKRRVKIGSDFDDCFAVEPGHPAIAIVKAHTILGDSM